MRRNNEYPHFTSKETKAQRDKVAAQITISARGEAGIEQADWFLKCLSPVSNPPSLSCTEQTCGKHIGWAALALGTQN